MKQSNISSAATLSSSSSSSPSTSSGKAAPDTGLLPTEIDNATLSVSPAVSVVSLTLSQSAALSANNAATSEELLSSSSTLSAAAAPYSSLYTITPPGAHVSSDPNLFPTFNPPGYGNLSQHFPSSLNQSSQVLPNPPRTGDIPLPPSLGHSLVHHQVNQAHLGLHFSQPNDSSVVTNTSPQLAPLSIGLASSAAHQHHSGLVANNSLYVGGLNGPTSSGISVATVTTASSHSSSNQSYPLDTAQNLARQIQHQQLLGSGTKDPYVLQGISPQTQSHLNTGHAHQHSLLSHDQGLLQYQGLDILSQQQQQFSHSLSAVGSESAGVGSGISPSQYHHPLLHQPLPQGFNLEEFVATYLEPLPEGHASLYISQLSYFCSEKELSELLAPYGPILALTVRKGIYGTTLMHGFVLLSNTDLGSVALGGAEARARRAVAELDGQEFMGRNVRVALTSEATIRATALGGNIYSTPGGNIVGLGGPGDIAPPKSAQIHVSFLAKRVSAL
jgi:hypothetical protein